MAEGKEKKQGTYLLKFVNRERNTWMRTSSTSCTELYASPHDSQVVKEKSVRDFLIWTRTFCLTYLYRNRESEWDRSPRILTMLFVG